MPIASWPATMNQVVDGDQFSYTFGNTTQKTEQQNGAVKRRRKFTKRIDGVAGKMTVPYSLFDTFETFYNVTINGGIDAFTMTHPITGASATFKFASEPVITHKGGINFNLQIVLELQP